MWMILSKLGRYVFSKAALFVVLLVVAVGLVIAYQAVEWVEGHYEERLVRAEENAETIRAEIAERHRSLIDQTDAIQARISEEKRKIDEKQKAISELDEKWAYLKAFFTGGSDEYEREKARIYAEKAEAERRQREFQQNLSAVQEVLRAEDPAAVLLEQHEAEVEDAKRSIKELSVWRGEVKTRVASAFSAVIVPVSIIFVGILIGPIFWRMVLYYAWAPWAQKAVPIQLVEAEEDLGEPAQPMKWSESAPAHELELEAGEVALIRTRFLQSSDEPLGITTRWLWSWRYPLTSLGANQYLLTRLEHQGTVPDNRSVTISDMADGLREVAWVHLKEGESLCFRPSYLAGVTFRGKNPPKIQTRWRIFALQSWMTLQFRFFLIEGECRLIFAAGRGLKPERVRAGANSGKRVNQDMTVAFQPGLSYGSRRAETAFAGYISGQNPLFDDFFSGEGTVAVQQILSEQDRKAGKQEGIWHSLLSGIGKLFGL